jgi:hypothetical protein
MPETSLLDLPDDVLNTIFQMLSFVEQTRLSRSCKRIHKICTNLIMNGKNPDRSKNELVRRYLKAKWIRLKEIERGVPEAQIPQRTSTKKNWR